ncbi:hypothetical protein VMT65_00630 [Nocardia sp. CDC153]|uniref:hypothetical protein n=1 Tax=Nocardia sp. CDC153 TaxID=3112167 RepID=UPI002DBF4777|nr:hypothetical protein [Nocardia sp. CDC153]MEC3951527.1 hypothetical protein [Nocardia sp. CDC153]
MKRTAVGLIAMVGITVGVALVPAGASAQAAEQAPVTAPIADSPGVSSSGIPAALVLQTLLKCLSSGSGNLGAPGSTQTGCLNS